MNKNRICAGIAAMVCITCLAAGAFASEFRAKDGAWEVGAFGGYYVMEGNQWLKDAPSVGGSLGYFFTKDLQLLFDFSYNPTEYKTDLKPAFSYLEGEDVNFYHYRGEMRYHVPTDSRFVPYLAAGAGVLHLDGADIDNEVDAEFSWGAGLKFFILKDIALNADVRHVIPLDKYIRKADDAGTIRYDSSRHYNNLEATMGVSVLFGGKSVAVPVKKCQNVPAGCLVDADGCAIDKDRDGVCDGLDKCPNTPYGCKVDARGCPFDGDKDGVCDGLDQCPDTPLGCVVDAQGCSLDGDKDGVCDGIDKCPNTPAGIRVDSIGCGTLRINFEFDSAKIKPESYGILDEAAGVLKGITDTPVEIAGHTDSKGTAAYNLKLSQRRAEAVKAYFVSKGLPASMFVIKGYGATQPVASNATEAGRAENRRIELKSASK